MDDRRLIIGVALAALATESARADRSVADADAQTVKADVAAQGAGLASNATVEGAPRTGG